MLEPLFINTKSTDAGLRLDSFLASRLPDFSRSQINKIIKSSLVSINNQVLKSSYKLLGHGVICVQLPAAQESELEAINLSLDIIFCDDDIAVINKRAGMIVHPGAGVREHTLVNGLLYEFPKMEVGGVIRPGIVHRLDKDTSGLIVVALTHKAHEGLSSAFKNREVIKIYRAFCYGEPEPSFELKTGHMRHPFNKLKFFTALPPPLCASSKVRMAHSSFKRLKSACGISELKAHIFTGRTHQIRAHLADNNYPLLGDSLYGGTRALKKEMPSELKEAINNLSGQALHAEHLSFAHPITKKLLNFIAPLPPKLYALEKALNQNYSK
jgi:23S rRNA pseudouridine1911/1915/1917 synthase